MKKTYHNQQKRIDTVTAVIYIIGDNYSNKDEVLRFFLGDRYQMETEDAEGNCLNVYVSDVLGKNRLLELYDFSSDRFLRQYLELYFEILPKPNLVLYCADLYSSKQQIQQWIQLIEDQEISLVFISDISTPPEKSQLISKISCFFQKDVVDYIYFPNLDKSSLYTCVCNLDNGMSLKNYIRKVNTWSSIKTFFKRLKTFINRKPESVSVV